MRMTLDKAKMTSGWLAFLLPIGVALPYDLFDGYDIIAMMSFFSMLAMPIIWYVLCLIDGLRMFPKNVWCTWLLTFHLLKVPLTLVGLISWYSLLLIRGFFSNGIPPQD